MVGSAALNQGQAQVLDSPRDPISLYLQGRRARGAADLQSQKLALQQQKQNTADMSKIMAHKYQDPGDRFRAWGQDIVNKANQDVLNVYNTDDGDAFKTRSSVTAIQGEADKKLNVAKEINNIYDEKLTSLKNLENIDQDAATGLMNMMISKDDPYQVDRDVLQNIEQVPAIYDLNGMVADSVKDVKDQFRNTILGNIKDSGVGLFMEIANNKMRFKDLDKTVDFLLRGDDVTDQGIAQKSRGGVISDRIRWQIAEDLAGSTDFYDVHRKFKEIQYDPKYAPQVRNELKTILKQFQQEERDVDIQTLGKKRSDSFGDGVKRNRIDMRARNLEYVLNPFKHGGTEPRKESQEAISRIIGGDFGGGKITDARFIRGGEALSPEWAARLNTELKANPQNFFPGNQTPEFRDLVKEASKHLIKSPGDKISLTIKGGTLFGEPNAIPNLPLDLSDPNAKAIVNALMNGNAGETKIPLDDVLFWEQQNKNSQYLDDDDDDSGSTEYLDD
jgi:hypothetical protein